MEPAAFVEKWTAMKLGERQAAQSHFEDLCRLLNVQTPSDADPDGTDYAFEYGMTTHTGGQGFADVFKREHFAWEYKGPDRDLGPAYDQLLRYAVALDNPPLLVVSDTKRIIVHTNFTNTVRETHELALDDLLDAKARDLLRAVFTEPAALKPKKTRQDLTKDAADEFSVLAQRLRDRGHAPEIVAHFVNRLVFCMFAEDVGLLPNKLFQRSMERSESRPEKAQGYLERLFAAMREGGEFGLEEVPWFNGGLFDTDEALALDKGDVKLALKAAKLDWSDIDPSILGTLFERGLDPSKRSQLGAHYTDREKIMMIVEPVIVRPLTAEWEAAKATIAGEMEKAAGTGRAATNALKRAEAARDAFLERVAAFRVLDPACGSGNFLYLSLLALKDIEHRANLDAEALGLPRGFPRVGPEAVRGIEINPYAAELARVSVWIGEIQWMRRNGFAASTNPVLRPLDHIECRDAVLAYDEDGTPVQAEWPEADVIVGNPPFLGNKKMIRELGEGYTYDVRSAYSAQASGGVDFVSYWFVKGLSAALSSKETTVGLVSTNSIRSGENRRVLSSILAETHIYDVWNDEPWVVDGANVRVSLISFAKHHGGSIRLNGEPTTHIYANLSDAIVDVSSARSLKENKNTCFVGVILNGEFDVPSDIARAMLLSPKNVNGRPNKDVIKRILNGEDFNGVRPERWVIDFGAKATERESSYYEKPFSYVEEVVRPFRERLNDEGDYEVRAKSERTRWWLHARARPSMRKAMDRNDRFIATPMVSSYRTFGYLPTSYLPDQKLVAFSRADDVNLGILSSFAHEIWTLGACSWIGAGNDVTYSNTAVYNTFPFPEGMTPDIPAEDYADDPRAVAIAEAAKTLDEQRERWLNPEDMVERVPEVVPGYPDRVVPKDEEAAKDLKKRTLTNLYNERPAWLGHAHHDLDRAVAGAYGWADDFEAGALTDDEVLARLFALNQVRAGA